VDYVSDSGETAGNSAARYALALDPTAGIAKVCGMFTKEGTIARPDAENTEQQNSAEFSPDKNFLCIAPQRLNLEGLEETVTVFFRSREERGRSTVRISAGNRELFSKTYNQLRPPEMEKITLSLAGAELHAGDKITVTMEIGAS
jgi:hypothetical protein